MLIEGPRKGPWSKVRAGAIRGWANPDRRPVTRRKDRCCCDCGGRTGGNHYKCDACLRSHSQRWKRGLLTPLNPANRLP